MPPKKPLNSDRPLFAPQHDALQDRDGWITEYDKLEKSVLQPTFTGTISVVFNLRRLRNRKKVPRLSEDDDFDLDFRLNDSPPQTARHTKNRPTVPARELPPPRPKSAPKRPPSSPPRSPRPPTFTPSPSLLPSSPRRYKELVTKSELTTLVAIARPHHPAYQRVRQPGMDLAWLCEGPSPPSLLTLDGLQGQGEGQPRRAVLTSPRSALVVLRNGVALEDLKYRPLKEFQRSGEPKEVAMKAYQHNEERRNRVLTALLSEYHAVCNEVSLADIIDFCQKYDPKNPSSADQLHINGVHSPVSSPPREATFLTTRKEKNEKLLKACRVQLERQAAATKERREVEAAAEVRRVERLRHLEEMKTMKQKEVIARQQAAMERREQHLREIDKKAKEDMERLVENQERLRAKEEERRQQHEETVRMNNLQRQAIREQNKMRIKANLERSEAIFNEVRERLMEKEEMLERRVEEIKESRKVDKQARAERAAQVAARAASIKKASQEEYEAKRQKALRKQEEADRHAEKLKEREREERKERAEKALQKQMERLSKKELAEAQLEKQRDEFLDRQHKRDAALSEKQSKHFLESKIHRQELKDMRNDKAFLVACRSRAEEFHKAVTFNGVERKRDRVTGMEREKNNMVQECRKGREQFRVEKQKLLESLKV